MEAGYWYSSCMAKRCEVCRRGSGNGHTVSHSNIKTKRTFGINLVRKRLDGVRTRVCTSCLRTRAKHLAEAQAKA